MVYLNNFNDIHIGKLIQERMLEGDIPIDRVCNFLKVSEEEIELMLDQKTLDCDLLLRWSKLLNYDFFRIYIQYLILYAPQDTNKINIEKEQNSSLPTFKKNIYTHEVIMYLVGLVESGHKNTRNIYTEGIQYSLYDNSTLGE
ncbi:hypothetical protein JGH11_09515 [Dysgonomonas sp. Marseille-P4677]|uniref:hypothetical protein n=1 Tax=Dysgonomonas sp. Marseille-P4677 TaxID=2364790 RepID=UPI0019131AD1|nr:hypothetical protein [Dysgonomonas sp. Marseille-P4677]MBK5721104.1 hypothetical protein [Dysgonomonas sp. Marseille-P4677]